MGLLIFFFFFSSRRRHTRFSRDWSSDVCSSDLTERCKGAILRELGFSLSKSGPLVLHVGRMVVQKGTDLCIANVPKLVFAGATVVLVGDGDPALVERATQVTESVPDQSRFLRAAPEATVHRLFAGADIVLVPSRFEPCGLVQ